MYSFSQVAHLQHLLSLEFSLQNILLPDLIQQDKTYFNMLERDTGEIDPRQASNDDLVFSRIDGDFFLTSKNV